MARQPDETIIIDGGYLANLWRMNDGWWLYDTPEIEGNRAQEESRDEAIEAAIEGIDMIRNENLGKLNKWERACLSPRSRCAALSPIRII